ncbi:MAG: dUTP diphosphatase [Methyloligellaceae bacterium]
MTAPFAASRAVAVRLCRMPHGAGLPLPAYQSAGAAGLDIPAAVPDDATVRIEPGARALVPAGFALALPEGYEGQIRPRSGLANRHGVTVLNAPGTVDSDYRGEVMVLLINLGQDAFLVSRGDRIAQLVVQPTARAELAEVETLEGSARGSGGFGSTG